jgi:ATP-dependent helicase HrpB
VRLAILHGKQQGWRRNICQGKSNYLHSWIGHAVVCGQRVSCIQGLRYFFFDEIHATETNPEYALLFDAILCIRKHRQVRLVVASANYSVEMVAALNDIGGKWIVCRKRPFDVTEYTVTVPFPEKAISAAKHLALAQFKSGNTVLRFLSGKAEIESMSFSFLAAALDKEQVSPFHRDLEEFELDKVRNPANYPRIILASSLAETSLTLADVDLVIDLGLSRILLDEHEVIKVEDHASSVASKEQRRGRAGRVKKGSFVFLVVEESNLPPARYS